MATARTVEPVLYQGQDQRKSVLLSSISEVSEEERSLLPSVAVTDQQRPDRPLSRSQIIVILICSCTTVVVNLGVGTMPLLIPIEIIKKEYAYTWTGVLFMLYGVNVSLCELLQSKIVPFLGTKRAFMLSSSVLSICYFSFGFLDLTNKESVFAGLACAIRIVEGLCYSGIMNSVLTILCLTVPSKAILGISLIDGLIGVGYSFGPLVSGALFQASGFILPYALVAVLLAFCAVLGKLRLPSVYSSGLVRQSTGSLKTLYADVKFCGSVIVVFAIGNLVGFLDTTLEPYLAKFDKGSTVEGSIFFAIWFIAALSSPVWGYILRKFDHHHIFLLLGPFIIALAFAFFGPLPGLEAIGVHLGLSITCLMIMTPTSSVSLLAAVYIMLQRAENHGIENDIHTYAFISAIWLATLYFGEAIGSIISGIVLDKYDYGYVTVSLVSIELILGTIAGILFFLPWEKFKKTRGKTLDKRSHNNALSGGYQPLSD